MKWKECQDFQMQRIGLAGTPELIPCGRRYEQLHAGLELCLCLRQTVYFLRALTSELAAGKCRYSISDHPRRIRRTCLDDEVLMIGFREILGWSQLEGRGTTTEIIGGFALIMVCLLNGKEYAAIAETNVALAKHADAIP
ncbi:uncharacterized protein [Physcomitrium patens]|uniref:uncharacterized protein isoform X3 n=1 Tax=Physcomitrium patens TaxID=3218 RepID=UPI003CCCF89F